MKYKFEILLLNHLNLLQCLWIKRYLDRFGEDVDAVPVDAAHFRAMVRIAPSPPLFAWVFTFGGAIRIESPDDVLDGMRDMARWLNE